MARAARPILLLIAGVLSCTEGVEVGADRPNFSAMPDSAVPDAGEGGACGAGICPGRIYGCSDCIDNDQDGAIDLDDPDCLGPCQDAEDSFFGSVQNQGRCAQDCYFDDDSGFGNDDCSWSHHCDPLSAEPDTAPHGDLCTHAPEEPIQSPSGATCATAVAQQSVACLETCLPLTPTGCDCFGCCVIAGAPWPVWIGSNDGNMSTCSRDSLADPTLCRRCTQVESCLNPAL